MLNKPERASHILRAMACLALMLTAARCGGGNVQNPSATTLPSLSAAASISQPRFDDPAVAPAGGDLAVSFAADPGAAISGAFLRASSLDTGRTGKAGEAATHGLSVVGQPAAPDWIASFKTPSNLPEGLWDIVIQLRATGEIREIEAENVVWSVPKDGPAALSSIPSVASPGPDSPAVAESGGSLNVVFASNPGAPVRYAELTRENGGETETARLGATAQPTESSPTATFSVPDDIVAGSVWNLEITFVAAEGSNRIGVQSSVWSAPAGGPAAWTSAPEIASPSAEDPAVAEAGGQLAAIFDAAPDAAILYAELSRQVEGATETIRLTVAGQPDAGDPTATFDLPADIAAGELWDLQIVFLAPVGDNAVTAENAVWSVPAGGAPVWTGAPVIASPSAQEPAIAEAGGELEVAFEETPDSEVLYAELKRKVDGQTATERLAVKSKPEAGDPTAAFAVPGDIETGVLWDLQAVFLASGSANRSTLKSGVWTVPAGGPADWPAAPEIAEPSAFSPAMIEAGRDLEIVFAAEPSVPILYADLTGEVDGEMETIRLPVKSRPDAADPTAVFQLPDGIDALVLWSAAICFLASEDGNEVETDYSIWTLPADGLPTLSALPAFSVPQPEIPALAPAGGEFHVKFASTPEAPVLYAELTRTDGDPETVRLTATDQPDAADSRAGFAVPDGLTTNVTWDMTVHFLTIGDPTATIEDSVWSVASAEGSFDFVLVTDYHVGDPRGLKASPYETMEPVRREVMADMAKQSFLFSLLSGDLTYTASQYDDDYPAVKAELDDVVTYPMYIVPGNHDMKLLGDIDGFDYWERTFGPTRLSFDIGAWHFVGFNSSDQQAWTTRNSYGDLTQEQFDWMMADLEDARDRGKHAVVFAHHCPSGVSWDSDQPEGYIEAKDLRKALAGAGATYFLCGHLHIAGQHERDGVTFINSGTAGSMPSDDAWGYTIFHANDDGTLTWDFQKVVYKLFQRQAAAYIERIQAEGRNLCEETFEDFNPE